MAAERFILMQSWWLASAVVRRHPDVKLIETHPGGGMYDCLTLIRETQTLAQINRAGSVDGIGPVGALFDHTNAGFSVTELETAARLTAPAQTPASTPAVLSFRVIAQIMAITLNDKHLWDVRNVFHDSSGMGGGVNDKYLEPFPVAAERAREQRPDDLLGIPHYRYWGVLRDGEPVAVVDTDGFAYVGQQMLFLPDVYSAHSRRLTPTTSTAFASVLP